MLEAPVFYQLTIASDADYKSNTGWVTIGAESEEEFQDKLQTWKEILGSQGSGNT
jgi:hypothetical protein